MASEYAFTWGSLIPEVGHKLASVGIDPEPAIDMVAASSILILLAYFAGRKYRRASNTVLPSEKISLPNLLEYAIEFLYQFIYGFLGKHTKQFFPIMAGLFFFILFNNLIGSVPGFNPPSDKFSITFTLGAFVFVFYQFIGLKVGGMHYVKHFCGPVWWMAWLIFPIELISHFVRPFSLALRLFGNMTGDHKVVGIFFGIFPLVLPLPFMGLGMFVSFIQALVFLLLSLVYLSGALETDH